MLALVLSRDPQVHAAQLSLVQRALGQSGLPGIQAALPWAAGLPPMMRLPALLQLFPALRRLPLNERQALTRLVDAMVHADTSIDVFEFCLAKLLGTLLSEEISGQAPRGNLALQDAAPAVHILFATLARCGSDVEAQICAAYEAGMQAVLPSHPPYATYDDWPARTSAALDTLAQLAPQAKGRLIEGLVRTIVWDNQLRVEEDELLRTTCALLRCPVPALGGSR